MKVVIHYLIPADVPGAMIKTTETGATRASVKDGVLLLEFSDRSRVGFPLRNVLKYEVSYESD
jgi:hypothetical protein